MSETQNVSWVVVAGRLTSGFHIYGLFDSSDDAHMWAEENILILKEYTYYEVMSITSNRIKVKESKN